MLKKFEKTIHVLVCAVLIVQLVGCGTIMYPERKGQKAGRIDAGVAILDGIGLLFFLIPGIIAFAVDFNNGTIYLPRSARGFPDPKNIRQVKFNPKQNSLSSIEKIIKKETGYEVKLNQNDTEISELRSVDEMMDSFTEVLPGIQDVHVALLNK